MASIELGGVEMLETSAFNRKSFRLHLLKNNKSCQIIVVLAKREIQDFGRNRCVKHSTCTAKRANVIHEFRVAVVLVTYHFNSIYF